MLAIRARHDKRGNDLVRLVISVITDRHGDCSRVERSALQSNKSDLPTWTPSVFMSAIILLQLKVYTDNKSFTSYFWNLSRSTHEQDSWALRINFDRTARPASISAENNETKKRLRMETKMILYIVVASMSWAFTRGHWLFAGFGLKKLWNQDRWANFGVCQSTFDYDLGT